MRIVELLFIATCIVMLSGVNGQEASSYHSYSNLAKWTAEKLGRRLYDAFTNDQSIDRETHNTLDSRNVDNEAASMADENDRSMEQIPTQQKSERIHTGMPDYKSTYRIEMDDSEVSISVSASVGYRAKSSKPSYESVANQVCAQ